MGKGLGPLQKKIITFFYSQPTKRGTRREVISHFKKPDTNEEFHKRNINRAIRSLIGRGILFKEEKRSLLTLDIYSIHPSQRPVVLELNLEHDEVKKYLNL